MCRSYPTTNKELERAIIKRSQIESVEYHDQSFLWTREQRSWLYLQPSTVRSEDSYLAAEVSRFIIAIQTKDFDPEKYKTLSEVIILTNSP